MFGESRTVSKKLGSHSPLLEWLSLHEDVRWPRLAASVTQCLNNGIRGSMLFPTPLMRRLVIIGFNPSALSAGQHDGRDTAKHVRRPGESIRHLRMIV